MKTKPMLSIEDAKRVATAAAKKAVDKGWAIVIAIVDDGGHLLYFERLDGAKLGSVETAIEKARSAVLFGRPTKALEDIIASGRNAMLRLPQATPIQGGLPIMHDGALVGGIGISGVQSAQDEEVGQAGIDAL